MTLPTSTAADALRSEPPQTDDPSADPGHVGASPKTGFPQLPWSLMGMGLLIAWLCCTHLPETFLHPVADSATWRVCDYAMRAGDVGTFLVVALLGGRFGGVSGHRRLCTAALACGCAGSALAPVVASTIGGGPVLALVGVAAGFGGAVVFLMWAQAYCSLGPMRALIYGAASCLVAGLASYVVAHLDYASSCAAIACLLPVSGVMASICLSRLPYDRSDATSADVRYPVPWKLIVLMACTGFVSGFAGTLLVSVDGVGATHRILATVLFGVLVLTTFAVARERLDIRWLARVVLPCAVVSFVAIPIFGTAAANVVSFLVKFTLVFFTFFVLLVLANAVYRHDTSSSSRVFAIARASSEGAMLAGIVLRRCLIDIGALDNQTTLWLITILGLVGIVCCVALWYSERSVNADWGMLGIDAADGVHVPSERERLLERCAAVGAEHGLTPREAEVFELLAQGIEPEQIEQSLFVSHNTFKTHARHIYAKLGVHTREEAVALVR